MSTTKTIDWDIKLEILEYQVKFETLKTWINRTWTGWCRAEPVLALGCWQKGEDTLLNSSVPLVCFSHAPWQKFLNLILGLHRSITTLHRCSWPYHFIGGRGPWIFLFPIPSLVSNKWRQSGVFGVKWQLIAKNLICVHLNYLNCI